MGFSGSPVAEEGCEPRNPDSAFSLVLSTVPGNLTHFSCFSIIDTDVL